MRTIALIAFLTLIWSLVAQSPVQHVKKNMQAQQEAWNSYNIEGFMAHYWKSDSLKFIGSKGLTYGWQQTLDNYKRSYPNAEAMGQLTFTIYSAEQLSKEAVYVIGKWELKLKEKNVGGHYTLLWKKINKEWVIVADHTS